VTSIIEPIRVNENASFQVNFIIPLYLLPNMDAVSSMVITRVVKLLHSYFAYSVIREMKEGLTR
jgi:hypothetical protein